jgi:3-oxoacyl-[acyl-carrier-protein] synthase-3
MRAAIIATSHHLPQKVLTNYQLEEKIDTTDTWIRQRTGITQRHIATSEEDSLSIALEACENLLAINHDKNEITSVIVATSTATHVMPSLACFLCAKLGIKNAFAFDVNAACSGFVYAMQLANDRMKNPDEKQILVVGVDTMSKIVNWQDRSTAVLFGDGAGCVLLQRSQTKGIIASLCGSDITGVHCLEAKNSLDGHCPTFISMHGKEVFRSAVEHMSTCAKKLIETANIPLSSIDWVIPHQANQRILDKVIQKVGISSERLISTVSVHANTSAASIPLALDIHRKKNLIRSGDRCLILAFGAGFTWGGLICDL